MKAQSASVYQPLLYIHSDVCCQIVACSCSPLWDAFYKDFLPTALAQNTFKPAPAAEVHENGLEAINAGLEELKTGVSAKKLVVTLE